MCVQRAAIAGKLVLHGTPYTLFQTNDILVGTSLSLSGKKTLFGGLKEIRRVTDIINYSSSERKSTFNASQW